MTYLKAKDLLDNTASLIQDNSSAMRSKLLGWLNTTMQRVAVAKKFSPPWDFLMKNVSLSVSGNMVAKPSDFRQVENMQLGAAKFLSVNDQLTDEEAFQYQDDNAVSPVPVGYTTNSTSIVFWPGATGAVTLKYVRSIPIVTDTDNDTVFPVEMEYALIRGTIALYYEYDKDERFVTAPDEYRKALGEAIAWDNSKRPVPKRNFHGYMRDRA